MRYGLGILLRLAAGPAIVLLVGCAIMIYGQAYGRIKTRDPQRAVVITLPNDPPNVWCNLGVIAYDACVSMNQVRLPIGDATYAILYDPGEWTGVAMVRDERFSCGDVKKRAWENAIHLGTLLPGQTKRIAVEIR